MRAAAEIIPISEAHIEEFREAVGSVAREGNFLTVLDAFPLESTREYVLGNIANGYPHFIAILDGKIVGWCDISLGSDRAVHQHCGTMGMGVLKPYRGMGIGRRLLVAAIDAAGKKFQRIQLSVRETNTNARALYEKMGFILEGTLRKEWHTNGVYYDTHVMALLLPPLA